MVELSLLALLILLVIISFAGIVLIDYLFKNDRSEIVIPLGIISGVAVYIFLLNSLSFFVSPKLSSLIILAIFTFITVYSLYKKNIKFNFPKDLSLRFWIISLICWGGFLFWFSGTTYFGSDKELYYAIGKSFIEGNFPLKTPWQSDLDLSYHYGASIFLGSLQDLTNLEFEFLHRLVSFLILFSFSQILLWGWKRFQNWGTFLLYQLIPLMGLIILGNFLIVWPNFSQSLPFGNIRELIIWSRQIPSVHLAFETYGAPIVLELIVYFIHHALGISIFLVILYLLLNNGKSKNFKPLFLIAVLLSSLALTHEVLFISGLIITSCWILFSQIINKSFKNNFWKLFLLGIVFSLIIIFQGGIITQTFFNKNSNNPSVVFLPLAKENDFPEGVNKDGVWSYYSRQQDSKLFENKNEWQPFSWFHPGFRILFLLGLGLLFLLLKFKLYSALKISSLFFFASEIFITLYQTVAPVFLAANGNRALTLAYQFLGLSIILSAVFLIERFVQLKKIFLTILISSIFLWIIFISFLPSLGYMSIQQKQANYLLTPHKVELSETLTWFENNLNGKDKVLNQINSIYYFSENNYDTSQASQKLTINTGVSTPVFTGKYKAYTMEASPEYLDALLTLNPSELKILGIKYLLINSQSYKLLPEIRQKDLENKKYFIQKFNQDQNGQWERIFEIQNDFLNQSDLPGTFSELNKIIPPESKIYIDNWYPPRVWSNLRKALIFTLVDRKPYLDWGPGVYLNVERATPTRRPDPSAKYEYLVLNQSTDPKSICDCQTDLIWKGLNDNIYLYKVIY